VKKIYKNILSLLLFLNCLPFKSHAVSLYPALPDSIVDQILFKAREYEQQIGTFKAALYMKTRFHIEKRNNIIKYLPLMFRVDPEEKNYLIETYDSIHYTSPNIYDAKLIASYGSTKGYQRLSKELLQKIRLNVYSPSILPDKLISPLTSKATKYYEYKLRTVVKEKQNEIYEIEFIPKYKNTQLIKGVLWMNSKDWTVKSIYAKGKYDFIHFAVHLNMGDKKSEHLLPKWIDAEISFQFLGNKVQAYCISNLNYSQVASLLDEYTTSIPNKYDLTNAYRLTIQPSQKTEDSLSLSKHRVEPLTSLEQAIYQKKVTKDLEKKYIEKTTLQKTWNKLEHFFLSSHTIKAEKFDSQIKISPLISPVLFSYSANKGISYRQELRFKKYFSSNKLLYIKPQIGYNFKYKEFYWKLYSSFNYRLKKSDFFNLEVGNGNRIYTDKLYKDLRAEVNIEDIQEKIKLNYYNDLYAKSYHNIECFNGFVLSYGFSMHRRTPQIEYKTKPPLSTEEKVFLHKLKKSYVTFAPSLKLKWTPGQYYYMNKHRKHILYSHYPTFHFLWERCFKGFLGSTGKYEQFEMDIQQSFKLGELNSLYYRVGGGLYTDKESNYFVDYVNLSQNNLPIGWNDDVSGEFQLLDRKWYNASSYYFRSNLTYESPFLFLHRIFKNIGILQRERVYLNLLWVESLHPYMEFGYAISTHLLEIGVFSNFIKNQINKVGIKFTIELFNN
jgi:hypothetical protein